MSAWTTYESRADVHGRTRRQTALRREIHDLNKRLPDTLSYHMVEIFDCYHGYNIDDKIVQSKYMSDQKVAIINSDNLNEKFIFSFPGEDIQNGSLVHWMDQYWLVTERDANTTVYTKAKLLQCNFLLKWVSADKNIIEQWCVVEDGTKLSVCNRTRHSLAQWKHCVKTTPLIAGNSLELSLLQRRFETTMRECLKKTEIGQSAAKPRTEERSTISLIAGVEASASKRGALNRICGKVKI